MGSESGGAQDERELVDVLGKLGIALRQAGDFLGRQLDVDDRMPVLLKPEDYDRWLHGSFDDALNFQQRCFPDELIEMTRTNEPWIVKRPDPKQPSFL